MLTIDNFRVPVAPLCLEGVKGSGQGGILEQKYELDLFTNWVGNCNLKPMLYQLGLGSGWWV